MLARARRDVRFRDFLRMAVLLFGGAGTALAVVAIAGATRRGLDTLLYVAGDLVVPRGPRGALDRPPAEPTAGIRNLLGDARSANTLPELEPGTILFNRLWALVVLTVAAGGVGFFFPQVPAIATGYCLLVALAWRRQSAAVAAIEERDGVEFYVDRGSPLRARRSCCALPGLRRDEPAPADEPRALAQGRARPTGACSRSGRRVSHARRAVATP